MDHRRSVIGFERSVIGLERSVISLVILTLIACSSRSVESANRATPERRPTTQENDLSLRADVERVRAATAAYRVLDGDAFGGMPERGLRHGTVPGWGPGLAYDVTRASASYQRSSSRDRPSSDD